MNRNISIIILLALMWGSAGSLWAAIMLDTPETWSTGLQGWDSGIGTLGTGAANSPPVNPGAGGNPGGYLETTYDAPRLIPESDTLATTDADFTGNYAIYNNLMLSFDFFADVLPLGSSVFLESSADGSVWTYNAFSPTSAGSWENYQVGFSSGWTEYTSLGTTLDDALTDVSMIGLYFTAPAGGSALNFGLDNWTYSESDMVIPEPHDWAMLAMAVLGLAMILIRERPTMALATADRRVASLGMRLRNFLSGWGGE